MVEVGREFFGKGDLSKVKGRGEVVYGREESKEKCGFVVFYFIAGWKWMGEK